MIQSGKEVAWESQAMGSQKTKKGRVMAVVPAGASARKLVPCGAKVSHIKFDSDRSLNIRVLVAVPAGKNGAITHYYCPKKSVLENQGN